MEPGRGASTQRGKAGQRPSSDLETAADDVGSSWDAEVAQAARERDGL